MNPRRVAILGAGKRVLETALPAFAAAEESFEIEGVYARTARKVTVGARKHEVRPLDELERHGLGEVDLVYLAVGKDAVPDVLTRLEALEPTETDLLIDTPVVRFRHFRHARRTSSFRCAWVAEDCTRLPWIDAVRAAEDAGIIGAPERIVFDRSAYAYHGVATARAILGASRVKSGRRTKLAGGVSTRELHFDGRRRAEVVEPRDYSTGSLRIDAGSATIVDRPRGNVGDRILELVERDGACVGFRIGDVVVELAPEEVELARGEPSGRTVVARQEAMKRVGFLRLVRDVAQGRGGYPVADGLEDMVVDYFLEKLGRYWSTPLTSPRMSTGRAVLSTLTLGGG